MSFDLRTPFDEKSREILNRVFGAARKDEKPYRLSWDTTPNVSRLWEMADLGCDYGAEMDAACGSYPVIEACFKVGYLNEDSATNQLFETVAQKAIEFENRLYIAMLVYNAVASLEGDIQVLWNLNDGGATERVEEEFKGDRAVLNYEMGDELRVKEIFADAMKSQVKLIGDDPVPTFFETFSAFRAAAQTLDTARLRTDLSTRTELARAIELVLATAKTYGDLDENYSIIANNALDVSRDVEIRANSRDELKRIAKED